MTPRLSDLQTLFADTDALRRWFCRELGCPEAAPAPASPLVQIRGQIVADAFLLPVGLTGPTSQQDVTLVLDTGAFELLLAGPVADALGLPNLGPMDIAGVSGDAQAYQSLVTVTLGGTTYPDVHCVVDPGYTVGAGLFGLRFFITRQLTLTLDTATATLSIPR